MSGPSHFELFILFIEVVLVVDFASFVFVLGIEALGMDAFREVGIAGGLA